MGVEVVLVAVGSSPRPWGTLQRVEVSLFHLRFIPTPVGNTASRMPSESARPVHPHARGEHCAGRSQRGPDAGSSPRPWGTPDRGAGKPRLHRFIPTPVGNTVWARSSSRNTPVHPHARGEHGLIGVGTINGDGSSPRPWGTRSGWWASYCRCRFIPTPVGNTLVSQTSPPAVTVHPHARGEHAAGARKGRGDIGSSPRPWGTHRQRHRRAGCQRFIPTPVGNTAQADRRRGRAAVHPHARGEHRRASARRCGTRRFIPTPVGNTA